MGDNKGSSLVYVIIFITLLSIFSSGYMAISKYNMKSTLESRSYMEARLNAKSVHRTFCESLSRDGSDVMDCIRQGFESDCALVREDYDRMMDEEEADADCEAEADQEADADRMADAASEADADQEAHVVAEEDGNGDPSADQRWERYLNHVLGDKEYIMKGMGRQRDGVEVEITVKAKPLSGYVNVNTKVLCNGFHISMMADIMFDNSDEPEAGRVYMLRSADIGAKTYLKGNAVCRYYEEGP